MGIRVRKFAQSTILTHLEEAIQQGLDLDLGSLISLEKQSAIKKAIADVGTERLAPIKDKLPSVCAL